MIITKNYSIHQEKITELQVGDFFEREGELYLITVCSLSTVHAYNFSKDKIFRFCSPFDNDIIVDVVDKHNIEICYSV